MSTITPGRGRVFRWIDEEPQELTKGQERRLLEHLKRNPPTDIRSTPLHKDDWLTPTPTPADRRAATRS